MLIFNILDLFHNFEETKIEQNSVSQKIIKKNVR